ncbi:MAG: hypothetical protein JJE30_03775 [Desulfuromonadales bacterium]|nr:hypothetical protein [Desulfuromonadales bacterium]
MDILAKGKFRREAINLKDKAIQSNMDMIIEENNRVAEVAHNSEKILDDLDRQFEKLTQLNGVDITFLLFASALQCARQYLLSNKKCRHSKDSDGSKPFKKAIPKQYHEILLGPVPYDAFRKSDDFSDINTGISGANHRYTVLGHDPLLGWIFGTLNILTDSITKNSLDSYNVIPQATIDSPVLLSDLFYNGYELSVYDYKLLICSVTRHAIHLGSDAFTTQGLPIPIINNVAPDFTSKLMKHGIDIYGVSRAASLSMFINLVVAAIHGLFYEQEKYENRDVYEVKTRKILSYSNLIASTSNVIYVAMSAYGGNAKALDQLDVGGMIVTIYRLVNDYEFIRKVKEEFVFGGFDKLINGQEYNFEEI